MGAAPIDYAILYFSNRVAWAEWLRQHHATERGLWLRLAKTASEMPSITYAEALEVALCYGWIDGQRKSYDADSFLQKFTPRGTKSVWSKRNRELVGRLIASGEMQLSGLPAIDAAKADGRWERAYDSPGSATVPNDFQIALDEPPDASAFFDTLKGANRYAILHRIQTAAKPETRARRIREFIAMLQRWETLVP